MYLSYAALGRAFRSMVQKLTPHRISHNRILDDLIASIPQDVPSIYKTSHLLPLDLQPQMSFYVKGQKMLVESNEQKTDVIRANRMKLRETLSHNIEVQWSKKASSVQRTGGGGFTVMFSDGSCCTGDILVGADGINSTGECVCVLISPCRPVTPW